MLLNRRVNKENVHLYSGVPLRGQKQLHLEILMQMNGTRTQSILSEVTQTQKEKQGTYSFSSGY